jgi:hypothetical protein
MSFDGARPPQPKPGGRIKVSTKGKQLRTKQYYVARDDDNFGDIPGKSLLNGQTAYIAVHFPDDMTEFAGFYIYCIANATQAAADLDLSTTYGSAYGEVFNTHGEADNASTYNITDNHFFTIDAYAKGMFADWTNEDTGGISVTVGSPGHNVTVVMAEMYYY